MVTALIPATAATTFAAAETYPGDQGLNPYITLDSINNSDAKSQVTTDSDQTQYYNNTIQTELDAEETLLFRFVTWGSRASGASESEIKTNAMPHVNVFHKDDALTQKSPQASYAGGSLTLERVSVNQSNQTNVDIAIPVGTLQPNTEYALVFDKNLGVKKSDATIGRDIVFYFKTKAPITGLTLNKTAISASIGHAETLALQYNRQPLNASEATWVSSDQKVATVAADGTVRVVSEGTAEITATYRGNKVTCRVTGQAATYGMQGLDNMLAMVDPWDIKVLSESDTRYHNQIKKKFHDDEDVKFAVKMSAGMAQFDEDEFLKSKLKLFAIYDSSEGGNKEADVEYDGFDQTTQTIKLKVAKGKLGRGKHYLIVDKNLQGNNPGKILGKDIVFEFKVTDPQETEPVTGLSLNWETTTLSKGAQMRLRPVFEPEDATNQNLTWSSSSETIAEVSEQGTITAKAAGTAAITAVAQDGGHKATCHLTVIDSGLKLSAGSLDLSKNQAELLKVFGQDGQQIPADQLQWKSDDPGIAEVKETGSEAGTVRAKASGQTLIWVTQGEQKAVCPVTVLSKGNYGFQGNNGNTVCLKSPDDLYVEDVTQTYYLNGINPPQDGTKDIVFGFTMSAGMNNFNQNDSFVKNSLPHIKVYRNYPGTDADIAAQPNNVTGQAKLEMLEYDGKRVIYVKIPKLALRSGTYYLVFGKSVCGNNTGKNLGKDVVFRFQVQWSPETMQVQLPEDGQSLEAAVSSRLELGHDPSEIENLLVETKGYAMTAADFQYIREAMGKTLKTLDLTRAILPENKLPAGALTGCGGLQQVSLPPITQLLKGSLQNCEALTKLKFTGEMPPTVEDGTVLAGTRLQTIIVPSNALDKYKAADPWKNYGFYIEATDVTLKQKMVTVGETRSVSLTATVQPANASNKEVEWVSSNQEIATVKDGLVTGVKQGETIVIVRTKDGGHEASCKVTVRMRPPDIALSQERATLYTTGAAHELQLRASVTNSNVFTEEDVEWESSDQAIAQVSKTGLVTGKASGVAVITAWVDDQDTYCVVTIKEHIIRLDQAAASIFAGGSGSTLTLKPTVDNSLVSGSQVEWSSSDPAAASVSRTGIVTGKRAGTAVITAQANEKTAFCTVTVKPATLSLNRKTATLYTKKQKTLLLVPYINGIKAAGTSVVWKSSNPKAAVVSPGGVVNARKKGKTIITAQANGRTVSCRITVKNPTLTLVKKSATIKKGKTVKIKTKAAPKGKVTYKSKNKKIATVTKAGKVKGKKKGKTTIQVKCNGVTKNFKIRVK